MCRVRCILLGLVVCLAGGCSGSSSPPAGEKPLVGKRIPPGAGGGEKKP